ncbi:hypothetical protein QAD02_017319 [Eretmocerus hayati]|uniref:Uncharacterized protein n=1 Tax=Eretmocerus hayati TaxID=131215 RepID=A0ACC2PDJ1_9HYME|nr:hypothetical protein QAD02_017319 [Eretmocerus hayati]
MRLIVLYAQAQTTAQWNPANQSVQRGKSRWSQSVSEIEMESANYARLHVECVSPVANAVLETSGGCAMPNQPSIVAGRRYSLSYPGRVAKQTLHDRTMHSVWPFQQLLGEAMLLQWLANPRHRISSPGISGVCEQQRELASSSLAGRW